MTRIKIYRTFPNIYRKFPRFYRTTFTIYRNTLLIYRHFTLQASKKVQSCQFSYVVRHKLNTSRMQRFSQEDFDLSDPQDEIL